MTTGITKRWPMLRVLVSSHLPFVAVLWALFMVAVLVIATIIFIASPVGTDSVMHQAATQVPRWLLFGLGIDVISTYLRMQLAHGRTRREFTGQTLAYAVIVSGFAAALLTLGYLLELGLYGLFDRTRNIAPDGHLVDSAGLYPTALGTHWLSLLLWTVAGLVIGLGFFRSTAHGLLTIPVGIVIVAPSVTTDSRAGLPFFGNVFRGIDLGTGEIFAASAVLLLVGAVVVWATVRRVPMKAIAE